MNSLAADQLPLSMVGAIEFLGAVILAAISTRTRRNLLAIALAIGGVFVLTDVRLSGQPHGFVFAFANCIGFMLYIILGHRIANTAAGAHPVAARVHGRWMPGISGVHGRSIRVISLVGRSLSCVDLAGNAVCRLLEVGGCRQLVPGL